MAKLGSNVIHVNFDYYEPINKQQEEFHNSGARHKLLIGGYGAGKTYPIIHEALFTAFNNPGHQIAVFRNTWDCLRENIEREFIEVAEGAGAIKEWNKTSHNLLLVCNTMVRFRPLSMNRAQLKGLNVCCIVIDDPDVNRWSEVISFLFTRLRNSPRAKAKYFQTLIGANYEGHNWLWQKYIRGRKQGGNDKFAYWVCPTSSNPTLPEGFIEDLEAIHSESWMKRFVYCDIDSSYTGLIYEELQPEVHFKDLSWCEKDDALIKILAIDVGVTDPTVVLHIATDMRNVYVYKEWYHADVRTIVLGEYLSRCVKSENFKSIVIDPSSSKRDQNTQRSLRDDLYRDYGINCVNGDNSILYGIEVVKTLMTVKEQKTDNDEILMETHYFVDPIHCPNTIREKEIYAWKEPEMSEFDELAYKEKPMDKDNHCMDAERYGCVYLRKFLRSIYSKEKDLFERRKRLWQQRYTRMKFYNNQRRKGIVPDNVDFSKSSDEKMHLTADQAYAIHYGKVPQKAKSAKKHLEKLKYQAKKHKNYQDRIAKLLKM